MPGPGARPKSRASGRQGRPSTRQPRAAREPVDPAPATSAAPGRQAEAAVPHLVTHGEDQPPRIGIRPTTCGWAGRARWGCFRDARAEGPCPPARWKHIEREGLAVINV